MCACDAFENFFGLDERACNITKASKSAATQAKKERQEETIGSSCDGRDHFALVAARARQFPDTSFCFDFDVALDGMIQDKERSYIITKAINFVCINYNKHQNSIGDSRGTMSRGQLGVGSRERGMRGHR